MLGHPSRYAHHLCKSILGTVLGILLATAVAAQPPQGGVNVNIIEDNALAGSTGVIGVNTAAGDNHVQANQWSIGVGTTADFGHVDQTTLSIGTPPELSIDRITDNAFQGVSGLLSVNQAAGSGSAESNQVCIGIGMATNARPVSASNLRQTVGSATASRPNVGSQRADIIDGQAFSGASGVVQVNQSAGSGNGVSNRVLMDMGFMDVTP